MKPKLVIWGASGHASVVADIIRSRDEFDLVGFLDDVHPERRGEAFCAAQVLGGREQLDALRGLGVTHVIAGFGNPEGRSRMAATARAAGFDLGTAVHPAAVLGADVRVGSGTVIKAGAILDSGVTVGDSVLVGHGTTIGHESRVLEGVTLAGGVHLAGLVQVDRHAWLGTGVVVRDRVRIGARCLVGVGAVVVKDLPDDVVAYGVPARIHRKAVPSDFRAHA